MNIVRLRTLVPAYLAFVILASSWLACAVAVPATNVGGNTTANDVSTFAAGSRALAILDDAILMEERLYGQNADTYNPLDPAFQVASTYWLESMCRSALQVVPVTLAYSWRSLGSSSCIKTPGGHSVVDPGSYLYCTNRTATPSPCSHDGSLQSSAFVAGVFATLGSEPYFRLPFVTPAEQYWTNYDDYSGWTELTPAMLASQKAVPQIGDIIAYAPPPGQQPTQTQNEAGHVAIVVFVQPPQNNTNGYLILAGAGQPSNLPQSALPLIGYNIHPDRGNFYKVNWYAGGSPSTVIENFNNENFQGLIRYTQAEGTLPIARSKNGGGTGPTNTGPTGDPSGNLSGYFAPYSQEGNLVDMMNASKASYLTMAFLISGGGCKAIWGGGQNPDTVAPQIKTLQGEHKDVIISFGGSGGQEPAHTCTDPASLEAEYASVMTTYNVTHLDFDIEGGTEGDPVSVGIRNQALALLEKAYPKVQISYTLPVLTTGLISTNIVMQDAIAKGVVVNVVNLMVMDYGATAPGNQMGQNAINAATSTEKQLAALYPKKTPDQVWAMIGLTPMIGINDTSSDIFTPDDANIVLKFAEKQKIGELSFWSLDRDKSCSDGNTSYASPLCSSISQSPYQFASIFEQAYAPPK